MPRQWIGRNVRSLSTISTTLLSEFYAKTIDDRQMLRFLLISSISRKWKSCCQGIKRIMNWRISYPPIALPAHIYISLHIVLILCTCKRLIALHSSPRVSYEHARSPIQTAPAVFGCNCLLTIDQTKIFRLFIASLYTDRMRNDLDNLIATYPKICVHWCWFASKIIQEQPWRADIVSKKFAVCLTEQK